MRRLINSILIIVLILSANLNAIPIGEVVRIDIPWVLSCSSDSYLLVGGIEGAHQGLYWTEDDGVVEFCNNGTVSDISDNGIIAGAAFNEEIIMEAAVWRTDSSEPNFLGHLEGSEPMSGSFQAYNTVNAISNDGSTVVGLHWYSEGIGSAKAYKWDEEGGIQLLPKVMERADSRADCISSDGSLIGGYAGDPNTFMWKPVLWSSDDMIELPYINDGSSTVFAISPNGEWCAGDNGPDGIIWHNQEIAELSTEGPEFIQIKYRTITDGGWAGGELANWNSMVAEPIIYTPETGMVNAVEFFEERGVTIPDDYQIFRVRRISNDHLTFIINGTDLNTYQYQSSIIKIAGPHSVYNLQSNVIGGSVNLSWNFNPETPSAEEIVILRDGVEIAQLGVDQTNFDDSINENGEYTYEIFVRYSEYDDSIKESVKVSINSVDIDETTQPNSTELLSNYPNPFNPTTTINYLVSSAGDINLNIYSSDGTLVKELVKGNHKSGRYSVEFDGKGLSSGIYYYSLTGNGFSSMKKMVLIK